MSAVDSIKFMNERDILQQKLNNIQKFLNYQLEHCTDDVDENASGCRRAPNIYKDGIYNNTRYMKHMIECIMEGIEVDYK